MRASRGAIRAVTDEEILAAYRLLAATEGVFCEPASAASVAGPAQVRRRRRRADRVRADRPRPEGSRTAALEQAGAVVPCEPQLRAIERAVLG